MKILYIDLLSPIGHKNLNKALVKILVEFAFVDVVWQENYIEEELFLSLIEKFYAVPKAYYRFHSKAYYRIYNYNKIKWILRNIDINNYDIVFISSYETISFALAWPRKIKPRVLLLNHNNLDGLSNRLKKYFFSKIPGYVEHIVFEEYMKKYLVERIKISNKIWVIRHPIETDKVREFLKLSKVKLYSVEHMNNLVFAPSSSNDENFIFQLINLQKEKGFLNNTNFTLFVKSKQYEYKDSHLIVVKRYLSYEEYIMHLGRSSLILLPYPKDFQYRISGVLFDAIAFRKKIIASSIPLFCYFIEKYPFLGRTFNNVYELGELISFYSKQISNIYSQDDKALFEKLHNAYSIDSLKKHLSRILKAGER